jgi:putative transposase
VQLLRPTHPFLKAQVQGRWFYLYLILDLWSRKIVGYEGAT